MNRLTSVIGPAPSELAPEIFIIRLRKERERVRTALDLFKQGYSMRAVSIPKTAALRSKKAKAEKLDALLSEHGLSGEELAKLMGGK